MAEHETTKKIIQVVKAGDKILQEVKKIGALGKEIFGKREQ